MEKESVGMALPIAIVLVSAETVIHKYNGSLHLEIEEQIFRVNVLLNL